MTSVQMETGQPEGGKKIKNKFISLLLNCSWVWNRSEEMAGDPSPCHSSKTEPFSGKHSSGIHLKPPIVPPWLFGLERGSWLLRGGLIPATGVPWGQCLSVRVPQVRRSAQRRGGRQNYPSKAPAFQLTGETANISAPVHLSP